MVDFPSSLPGFLRGYRIERRDHVLRSEMDNGIAKLRRKTSQQVIDVDGSMTMTPAQASALELFYDETTGGGVLQFDFTLNGKTYVTRFRSPPKMSWLGGNLTQAEISLELLRVKP